MKNKRVRALGVPLRSPGKFRRHVRIDSITHAYTNRYAKAQTMCGISYTHKEYLVSKSVMMAKRTSRDVDCMTCLVQK